MLQLTREGADHGGLKRLYGSANGETYSLCLSSAGRQLHNRNQGGQWRPNATLA